jgi:urease accessory protein
VFEERFISRKPGEELMSPRSAFSRVALAGAMALVPALASAHTGHGALGLSHGFAHPLSGIDHILAMVAVGIFAANLGGRALWAVPLSFMAMMAVGGAFGIAEVPLPFVEIGIAVSIIVLGLIVAVRYEWPIAAAMALVGVFAIFHGLAHGAEMPSDASGAFFAMGFVLATGLLHLVGIAIGFGIARSGQSYSPRIAQAGGAAVAVAGLLVLGGVI